MSRRRRTRGGGGHEEGSEPDERWMASYMDMITVLMCMFMVLYAMSTIDQAKFNILRNSLANGFGVVKTDKMDTAKGVIVPPDQVDDTATGFAGTTEEKPLAAAKSEVDALDALRKAISKKLGDKHLSKTVDFSIDATGLTINLVGSSTYFDGNSAVLRPKAVTIIDAIGSVLAGSKREISVEGNAADWGSAAPFPTVWELSAARSTSVLRHLVERDGIKEDDIWSVGYGSSRPVTTGSSEHQLALNRRVDIVVHSAASDRVRALIPQVTGNSGAG